MEQKRMGGANGMQRTAVEFLTVAKLRAVQLCMHAKPLSEDLFRLLSVPARVQDGATAAAVRISGDG
jgi:hypothetical protein